MKKSIINGLLAGIATIVVFQLAYMIDAHWMVDYRFKIASTLIFVPFMGVAASAPALVDVKKGIQAAFLVFIIGNALYYLYYFLQFNVFDTNLLTLLKEEMVRFGGVKMDDLADFDVVGTKVFYLFIRSLIGGFILSSMIAVILNRR